MKLMAYVKLLFCIILSFIFSSCETCSESFDKSRIEKDFIGYIPGRISVLKCLDLASNLNKKNRLQKDIINSFCSFSYKKISNDFEDQPYLEVLKYDTVRKNLEHKNKVSLFDTIQSLWEKLTLDNNLLDVANDFSSFYNKVVKVEPSWQFQINEISKLNKHSDALLIPIVFNQYQSQEDNRGLLISTRRLNYGMLLIDIKSYNIIWFYSDYIVRKAKEFRHKKQQLYPSYPQWSDLFEDIHKKNFWVNFPGMIF